jgi:hypothetical protein
MGDHKVHKGHVVALGRGGEHNSMFIADLPETERIMTTYVDDTAILATHQNPTTDSRKLQNHLNQLEKWLKHWCINANKNKSNHVNSTLQREVCPTVTLKGNQCPQGEAAR